MSINSSHDVMKSAFHNYHSTETTLLKILNNTYANISPSLYCQMVLLYLPFTSDSIHHDILVPRLEMIGIKGSFLKWNNLASLLNSVLSLLTQPSTTWSPTRFCHLHTSIIHIYIEPIRSIISQFTGFSTIYMLTISNSTPSSLYQLRIIPNYLLVPPILNTVFFKQFSIIPSTNFLINIPMNSPSFPSFYLDMILIFLSN